ncbi:hypothetical protein TRAPUB_10783 [Trametes pubescens]|uniref:Uncharacterized protein n=1 Tax=Trametes pubescens TaxID=154538 RepID=A0A1M2VP88_TRAPU|nr:hypothetical protein TRAPUB_14118 [Trametes pubescens]OJT09694.1 hypothetical protein TRAPUB_13799 [Trametes pubescens]OJT09721.1 hypothetical protein TRAPUB_13789 [Trametes pubescens]OJT12670.1 hypothetical protein TRAPUB_10783 [Trametes pubescens]
MAPGPQWLMIDADRGIDQATWLRKRVELATTTKAPETSVRSVGVKIAEDFTAEFPRDVTFYDPKRKRMETSDEALERTAKRENQVLKWVCNHWAAIASSVQQPIVPVSIDLLDARAAGEGRVRARSARDFFMAANPKIAKETREELRKRDIRDPGKVQIAINTAYSEAIEHAKEANEYAQYEEDSRKDKENTAAARAERQAEAAESSMVVDRERVIADLQYTIHKYITALAAKTETSILVAFGGLDGNGKPRKWMLSSEEDGPNDILPLLTRDSVGEFHEVFDEWITARYPAVAPHARASPYMAPLSHPDAPSLPTTLSRPATPSLPSPPARATTAPGDPPSPSPASPVPSDDMISAPLHASSSPAAPAPFSKATAASPPARASPASSAPLGAVMHVPSRSVSPCSPSSVKNAEQAAALELSQPYRHDTESRVNSPPAEKLVEEQGEDLDVNRESTPPPSADCEESPAQTASGGTPDAQDHHAKAPRKRKAADAKIPEVHLLKLVMARQRATSPARRTRSSLARDAAALLSPTKTKDTQDPHRLAFKNFAKCLADQQPRCPRVCSHKASGKQLQYLRENSDDGRYFVRCQEKMCSLHNRPQYVTEALSNADLCLLRDKRAICEEERKAARKAARLEKQLARRILQGAMDEARRSLGHHRTLDSNVEEDHYNSESDSMEAEAKHELDDDGFDGDIEAIPFALHSTDSDAVETARSPVRPSRIATDGVVASRIPFWIVHAYIEDGAPALTFQFDFPPGLGIGPQQIFEPFALGHRAKIAYQSRRTNGWVFTHYDKLDFIALLLDSGEELVWVKWGVTNLPGLAAHVGPPQWPTKPAASSTSTRKATPRKVAYDPDDVIDLSD